MDRIPAHTVDTQRLLTENETFCMMPWVHIHKTPEGVTLPCCIGNFKYKKAIPENSSIAESVNSDFMKQLRVDMLHGRRNAVCKACYNSEKTGHSFRQESNQLYGKYLQENIMNTTHDGTLHNFKMRHFDIRLNNVCNFKCRTCNAGYSSLWEAEDIKQGLRGKTQTMSDVACTSSMLKEILEHIPHMDRAYFAGGEPLVAEEHYLILDSLLQADRTDVCLVYNSNASKLKFKKKDVLKLWEKFEQPVEFFASVDHFGSRAEYIRHGTRWPEIEKNLKKLKAAHNVKYSLTTTVSCLNYPTLHSFIEYIIEQDLWPQGDFQINPVWFPEYLSPQALPEAIKQQASEKLNQLLSRLESENQEQYNTDCNCVYAPLTLERMRQFINTVNQAHTWPENQHKFQQETQRLDKIRTENFSDTFPELRSMLDV